MAAGREQEATAGSGALEDSPAARWLVPFVGSSQRAPWVVVRGAGGKPSPAQKVQSSNKRDRRTAAAQAAGSWLKKIGTSTTPSTNP